MPNRMPSLSPIAFSNESSSLTLHTAASPERTRERPLPVISVRARSGPAARSSRAKGEPRICSSSISTCTLCLPARSDCHASV